jgi:hypothetical protein
MATAPERSIERTDLETDFYLPATSISSALETTESLLVRVFGRHGRILIPDTYNK